MVGKYLGSEEACTGLLASYLACAQMQTELHALIYLHQRAYIHHHTSVCMYEEV